MEAIKFDIQTDVRVKERSSIFFSRHVTMHPLKKKKKIEKKRRVKLSKITILFAKKKKKKIYSIQFPYKYLLAMFITFSCVEMLKRDALCSQSLF